MSDWKHKIDETREQKEKRMQEELKTQQEKVLQKRIQILQKNFQCCMCGKLPTRPLIRSWSNDGSTFSTEDWSYPGDLYECNVGAFHPRKSHWACDDHYHLGFCYNHRELINTNYRERSERQRSAKGVLIVKMSNLSPVVSMLIGTFATFVFIYPLISTDPLSFDKIIPFGALSLFCVSPIFLVLIAIIIWVFEKL